MTSIPKRPERYPVTVTALLCILCIAVSSAVTAQSTGEAKLLPLSPVDLSVPASPAFTLLGITPSEIARPINPRQLATSLLNGVDENGNLQAGVAIDLAPSLFTEKGRSLDLAQYQGKDGWGRAFARTQVSIATAKGIGSDDKSTRLALGLHVIPFDRGDPRMDKKLIAAYGHYTEEVLAATSCGYTLSEQKKDRLWSQVFEQYKRLTLNKPQLALALAQSWIQPEDGEPGLRSNGYGIWASYGYGFRDTNQLIFHVRHRQNEIVPDEDNEGVLLSRDSTILGVRYRLGQPDVGFSLETLYTIEELQGRPKDQYMTLTLAAERKIGEDHWLVIAMGGQSGRKDGNQLNFGLSVKWALPEERQVAPQTGSSR